MFSIIVEEVFFIRNGRGIALCGKTSGEIRIGSYLIDISDRTKHYKVTGIEMSRNIRNPSILIEPNNYEPMELKGKTLESQ